MATTALFVEILVIGALAEAWLITLIFAIATDRQLDRVASTVIAAKELQPLLAIAVLALTYAIGWVLNFAAERLFRFFGQRKFRDQPFIVLQIPYENARAQVLQNASDAVIHELRMDRHIIRVARANVINFAGMAVAVFFSANTIGASIVVVLIVITTSVSIASFFQWLTRYRAYYRFMASAYEAIVSD